MNVVASGYYHAQNDPGAATAFQVKATKYVSIMHGGDWVFIGNATSESPTADGAVVTAPGKLYDSANPSGLAVTATLNCRVSPPGIGYSCGPHSNPLETLHAPDGVVAVTP